MEGVSWIWGRIWWGYRAGETAWQEGQAHYYAFCRSAEGQWYGTVLTTCAVPLSRIFILLILTVSLFGNRCLFTIVFRFMEISGLDYEPAAYDFTGKVVYDEMATNGTLET